MGEVMNYIKDSDLAFVSTKMLTILQRPRLVEAALQNQSLNFSKQLFSEEKSKQQPNAPQFMNIYDQQQIQGLNLDNLQIADGLKLATGGEDFFRSTNVFASQSLAHQQYQ